MRVQQAMLAKVLDEDNVLEVVIPVKYKCCFSFEYYKDYNNPDKIDWKYDEKDITFYVYKVDNPDNARTRNDFDNWLSFEAVEIVDEKETDFLDYLQNLGYDGFYMQEKGVLNIGVFSPPTKSNPLTTEELLTLKIRIFICKDKYHL